MSYSFQHFCIDDPFPFLKRISLTNFIDEVVKLSDQDAIFLFELYSDHIQMTKTLKDAFKIKHQLKEFSLKIPDFYSIDLDLNKKTEAYVKELKKGKAKPVATEKKAGKGKGKGKPKFTANLEIEVEEEDKDTVPVPAVKQQLSSLQELSNVPLQITTPNFNKAVQKKELFKPPQPNKVATNILSPRIRVISPTGEIAEGNKLMELAASKNGSIKLSDYNPFNPFLPREVIVVPNNEEKEEVEEGKPASDLDQADQAAEEQGKEKNVEENKNNEENNDNEEGNEEEETAEARNEGEGEEEDDYKVPCFASN